MSATKKTMKGKTLALNKRGKFDYEILETFEAGIVLTGPETKSAKEGHIQLKGAFVSVNDKQAILRSAYIAPYKPANLGDSYDPNADRILLMHKRELKRLMGKKKEAGLTLLPIRVYLLGRLVKVEVVLARGKKKYEKKDAIKKRELDREARTRMYSQG